MRNEENGECASIAGLVPIKAPEVSSRNKNPAGIAPRAIKTCHPPKKIKYFFIIQLTKDTRLTVHSTQHPVPST
ncbi:MAG: hypothetical protein WCO02_12640 [Bacteroidota bacterium]